MKMSKTFSMPLGINMDGVITDGRARPVSGNYSRSMGMIEAVNSHDKLVEALRYIYEESRSSVESDEVARKALEAIEDE